MPDIHQKRRKEKSRRREKEKAREDTKKQVEAEKKKAGMMQYSGITVNEFCTCFTIQLTQAWTVFYPRVVPCVLSRYFMINNK